MAAHITRNIVATILGLGIVWAAFFLLGPWWGAACTLALLLEAWALANTGEHDTISDIIREFARKQLLTPWLFGFAFGIGIATDYIHDRYVIAALALLQGHFFFTLNEKREEAIMEETREEVRDERREARNEIRQEQGDRRRG
jgi:hypothetical protein